MIFVNYVHEMLARFCKSFFVKLIEFRIFSPSRNCMRFGLDQFGGWIGPWSHECFGQTMILLSVAGIEGCKNLFRAFAIPQKVTPGS